MIKLISCESTGPWWVLIFRKEKMRQCVIWEKLHEFFSLFFETCVFYKKNTTNTIPNMNILTSFYHNFPFVSVYWCAFMSPKASHLAFIVWGRGKRVCKIFNSVTSLTWNVFPFPHSTHTCKSNFISLLLVQTLFCFISYVSHIVCLFWMKKMSIRLCPYFMGRTGSVCSVYDSNCQ